MRGFARAALGVGLFTLLATLNSGGYRYGAADQAFYIPAILDALNPALFPRDGALVGPQARFFFIDEIVAGGIRVLGGSIESWFLAGYLLSLIVLALSLGALGRTVFSSPLAVTTLLAIYTLKHRIAKTGVNTLEGYFHPRVLVFAAGVAAVTLYLRGRPWLALGLVALAGLLHPTTAAFFVLLIGTAAWVTEPRARRALTAIGLVAALTFAWLVTVGPWRDALVPMDDEWRRLLSSKDYLFPVEVWPLSAWAINLATAGIAILGLAARLPRRLVRRSAVREGGSVIAEAGQRMGLPRRSVPAKAGTATPRERGLLAGAVVLIALFIVTLPAVEMGLALAVQLQISRVFWLLELLAMIPLVWWLVDRPAALGRTGRRVAIGVTSVLVAAAAVRGGYVAFVEREPAVFRYSLPESDWSAAMRWIQTQTPIDAHILADPGHAFLYGYPVRFIGRDVYLEDVKDTAMALYNRVAAARVISRLRDLGDFSTLTADRAQSLATIYNLDYLVTTQPLALPEVAVFGRFHIYRLTPR
jgi:hypothetical protein